MSISSLSRKLKPKHSSNLPTEPNISKPHTKYNASVDPHHGSFQPCGCREPLAYATFNGTLISSYGVREIEHFLISISAIRLYSIEMMMEWFDTLASVNRTSGMRADSPLAGI